LKIVDLLSLLLQVESRTRKELLQLGLKILRFHRQNGNAWLIGYLKEAHILTYHFLSGKPRTTTESPIWVGLIAGLPKFIPGHLRGKMRSGDILTIRLVNTVLGAYRLIEMENVPKLETIEGEWTGSFQLLPELQDFLRTFCSMLPHYSTLNLRKPKLWLTTSAGPNGGIASISALYDAYALYHDKVLWKVFKEWVSSNWGKLCWLLWVVPFISSVMGLYHRNNLDVIHSRLHFILEPAGKTRIVAIADYWTQTALRSLHLLLFDVLRKIPQDGTFDHNAAVARIRKEIGESSSQEVYSFDLTAATDRVPAVLYQCLLAEGRKPGGAWDSEALSWAQQWKDLLILRSWSSQEGDLRYHVGQPMGAYSSWALLALMHHAIVQFAACRAGHNGWFTRYCVLGDDIVIYDRATALSYQEVLADFGIGISAAKSLVSETGVFEFAKRIASPGAELSGVPVSLVYALIKNIDELPSFLRWMSERGFPICPVPALATFSYLLRTPLDVYATWLTRPIGELSRSIRTTLFALCLPGYPWYTSMTRLFQLSELTIEQLDARVRHSVRDDVWYNRTMKDELTHAAARSVTADLRPLKWLAQLEIAVPELNPRRLRLLRETPSWFIWLTPASWYIAGRFYRLSSWWWAQRVRGFFLSRTPGVSPELRDYLVSSEFLAKVLGLPASQKLGTLPNGEIDWTDGTLVSQLSKVGLTAMGPLRLVPEHKLELKDRLFQARWLYKTSKIFAKRLRNAPAYNEDTWASP
jgi:hypothetical protein